MKPSMAPSSIQSQQPSKTRYWVVVFAIVGVSAHLANALPDIEIDRAAGVGGAAVMLGERRSADVAWALLAVGSVILGIVVWRVTWLLAVGVLAGYAVAWVFAHRASGRDAMFRGLLAAVGLDLIVLVIALS